MIDPKKISILLVDPDMEVRRSLLRGLAPEGFLVLDIPDAREAAGTAKDILFDLLIIDPFVPFSRDLIVRMARFNESQKILFLSDYSPGTLIQFGLCPAGADILRKPLKEEDLKSRIRENLETGPLWKDLVPGGLAFRPA